MGKETRPGLGVLTYGKPIKVPGNIDSLPIPKRLSYFVKAERMAAKAQSAHLGALVINPFEIIIWTNQTLTPD